MKLVHQTENLSSMWEADAIELMHVLAFHNRMNPVLIFADPPFNIGVDYQGSDDSKAAEEYDDWLLSLIRQMRDLLAPNGSIWLNLPDQHAATAVQHAKALGLKLENWCIWHYRFGTWQPNRFIRSKSHALWFSKGQPLVNPETAQVPSDRAEVYSDRRCGVSGGTRMDLDVWGFDQFWGRVQGNNRERRPLHPNQLPEKYLERIIKLCSNAGDYVVDPFCGSGTTAVVAQALGRRFITGDLCRAYVESAAERLKTGAIRL